MAANTFNCCHTPPGLAHLPIQPANGRIRLPRAVPGLSASPESSRRRPSSAKSTVSHPCFVSGGAASQRPPLHRALLNPVASPKAQSAAPCSASGLARPRPPSQLHRTPASSQEEKRANAHLCIEHCSIRPRRPRPSPPPPCSASGLAVLPPEVAAGMNAASSSSPPASGHVLDWIHPIFIAAPSPAAA